MTEKRNPAPLAGGNRADFQKQDAGEDSATPANLQSNAIGGGHGET